MSKSSEGFFEQKCAKQLERIRQLEHECAELQIKYNEMKQILNQIIYNNKSIKQKIKELIKKNNVELLYYYIL